MVEVLVWGFPNSSGVLLAAYLDDAVYNSQKHAASVLPLVGTLCTGIMYCSGSWSFPLWIRVFLLNRKLQVWSYTRLYNITLVYDDITHGWAH